MASVIRHGGNSGGGNPFAHLMGWDVQASFKATQGKKFRQFAIMNPVGDYKGNRRMLWEYTRKVLGKDTENYAQEIGDCVSFGGKNVVEHLTCVEIALNGESQKFRNIFPPYFYGTSRVLVGQRQLGNSDGSTGVWLQRASKDYGVLSSDETNVPRYSGQIAKQWGYQGPPDEFIQIGKQHLIKTTSQVLSAVDAANAIYNGYPIAICSNQGFNMEASSDGFHAPRGSWGHCMAIIGYEDHPQHGLYFIILNSWADVHGRLKDFTSGADLPIGVLRVRGEVVDRMCSQFQDTWAFSQYDGYPDQAAKLDKALFDLIGN